MNTNNSNSNNIFCGLVSGYQGEGNTATPENAAQAVAEALHTLGVQTEVRAAVCVYHTDWGCPIGGEPVGAFVINAPAEETLKICEDLRVTLKQSTLTVCLSSDKGAKTLGFTAQIYGDLREVGAKWQVAAAAEMAATGTYVSCGIAEAEGRLIISAEANPQFTPDIEVWRKIVEKICAEIGAEPTFKEVGFNYLHD